MTTRTHAAGREVLEDALTGRLGAGSVRRIVLNPLQHGLADLLASCLPDPSSCVVDLMRTKFKPGRKLTAYYGVTVSGITRHVSLSWLVQPLTPALDAGSVEAEAGRRRVLAPFTRLAATSDDRRTTLLVGPADPRMPQLVTLSQPEHMATAIAQLAGAGSPPAAAVRIATVRYRPGQRHVLRVAQSNGGVDATTFVKLDRDDSGVRAVAVARAVGPILTESCAHAALAEPLGFDLMDRAALWRQAPGAPLRRWLTSGSSGGSELVGLLGAALRVLHDRGPRPASGALGAVGGLPAHNAAAEVAATLRAGEHLGVLLPELAARYCALAGQVADRLERLPGEASTFTHGDVKCDNILSDGHTLCLLDLDRCAWADPALDLAKVLADLRWWGATDGADVPALTNALIVGYGDCEPHRWARARTLAALFQLKLAARRITVDDVAWAPLVSARVRGAEIAMRVEQP